MRTLLLLPFLLTIAVAATAFDLGNRAPAKPQANHPVNVPTGRQGGDTILDAVPVTIPVVDQTGTTAGYVDDYDEVCPYDMSTSPDVVYLLEPAADMALDIDMFGSAYDTKIYLYDENLALVACNDDFHSDYTSRLENVPVAGGVPYYLVIDGYGGDHGDYLLNIVEFVPCEIDCPAWSVDEGEPPLAVDYEDNHNGGCNTDPDNPVFQPVGGASAICGVSGFYPYQGSAYRDTDWFAFTLPTEYMPVYADAEVASYLFELGPTDCGSVGVLQNVEVGPCAEGTMYLTGTPGTTVWIWFGPTTFAAPDGSDVYEYDYWIHFGWWPMATEEHTLTRVRSLFR